MLNKSEMATPRKLFDQYWARLPSRHSYNVLQENPKMNLHLSKTEIAQLNQEQLEAYARIHLDSERKLRELRDQATGRNRSLITPIVACVLAVIALIWYPRILNEPFNLIVIFIAVLLGLHWRTNQRIDAIVRLLKLDQIEYKKEAEQVGDGDAEEAV